MRIRILSVFCLAFLPLIAADPPGFVIWPKGMPPGGKNARFENHGLSVSHRDKNGGAEMHEMQTDIFVVQSGQAVLLVGGQIVDPKTESPGEIRGSTIKGGVKNTISAGDVVHIPAKVPHQFFLDPGQQINYFVVKVDSPK